MTMNSWILTIDQILTSAELVPGRMEIMLNNGDPLEYLDPGKQRQAPGYRSPAARPTVSASARFRPALTTWVYPIRT